MSHCGRTFPLQKHQWKVAWYHQTTRNDFKKTFCACAEGIIMRRDGGIEKEKNAGGENCLDSGHVTNKSYFSSTPPTPFVNFSVYLDPGRRDTSEILFTPTSFCILLICFSCTFCFLCYYIDEHSDCPAFFIPFILQRDPIHRQE